MTRTFYFASAIVMLAGCTTFGPITATNGAMGEKLGTACNTWAIAPITPFTWGRNDIRLAASNGGVRKIAVVDYETRWYGVYGHTCTNVYGD